MAFKGKIFEFERDYSTDKEKNSGTGSSRAFLRGLTGQAVSIFLPMLTGTWFSSRESSNSFPAAYMYQSLKVSRLRSDLEAVWP